MLVHLLVVSVIAASVIIFSPVAAMAQERFATQQVRFASGQSGTTIRSVLVGDRVILYRISAEAGQTLSVSLQASNAATYFNVYEPGRGPGDEALANSGSTGPLVPNLNRFRAALRTSGDHTISVYLMRSAARRGERTRFTLQISAPPQVGSIARPVVGDFADGLAGGPDFFAVAGVPPGDRLNVRRGPSASAPILARIANGARVKNLGCRISEAARWCRIETPGDVRATGWAAGRFLIEGSSP